MATFSQGKGLRPGPQLRRKGEVLEGLQGKEEGGGQGGQGPGTGSWWVRGVDQPETSWCLDTLRRGGPGPPALWRWGYPPPFWHKGPTSRGFAIKVEGLARRPPSVRGRPRP